MHECKAEGGAVLSVLSRAAARREKDARNNLLYITGQEKTGQKKQNKKKVKPRARITQRTNSRCRMIAAKATLPIHLADSIVCDDTRA